MQTSKSSAIDEILSKSADDEGFEYVPSPPGRKPATKPAKPQARNTQAWRTIEDKKESLRLDRKLKEIYEED